MRRTSEPSRRTFFGLIALIVLATLLGRPIDAHLRAASLLARYVATEPQGRPGFLSRVAFHPTETRDFALPGTRARLDLPTDVDRPAGLVIVHGVHYLGIDEPRLRRFAESIAQSGVAVLTPEVRELTDYRIEPASVDTIGAAAIALSDRLGRPVGVMGLSFAGGLSLVAAADPRYAKSIAFVAAVGAHDDLGRVLGYFVSNEAPMPDGSVLHRQAHDYGTVVLVYSHVEDFFAPGDVPSARDALRAWLHEDFDAARARSRALSPEGAAKMAHVFEHDVAALAPELRAEIARLKPAFAAVSPDAHLAAIRVPVYVLHGEGDRLIPPTEAAWLAHDTPGAMMRDELVSAAVEHVGLEGGTKLGDELALVHFLGHVLEATQSE